MRSDDILPSRSAETDEERRLREAINRLCGQMMTALDSAIGKRTADGPAQRSRNIARNHLTDFALRAMHTLHLEAENPNSRRTNGD